MSRRGETTARLIDLLNRNPDLSNAALAETLGVSKSRVSQIRIQINQRQRRRRKKSFVTATSKSTFQTILIILDKVKQIVRR
jgi:hypothetical protein